MKNRIMSVPRSLVEDDSGGATVVFEEQDTPHTIHTINLGPGNYAALKALIAGE